MNMIRDAVIIGGGLSGLTAARELAQAGLNVELLEQGKRYEDRSDGVSSETLVGLGGAGTISGGKLCFPPASGGIWRKTLGSMDRFEDFRRNMFSGVRSLSSLPVFKKAPARSMLKFKEYRTEVVLRNSMREFVTGLIDEARLAGACVRCGCRVDRIVRFHDSWELRFKNECGDVERLYARYVILATGRTSVPLLEGFFGRTGRSMPDLGIRITVDADQPAFSGVGQDVKLKRMIGGHEVRTFCVCCGGDSVKTSTRGLVHYDGHFLDHITDRTNLGILARSPELSGRCSAERYLTAMQPYVDRELSLKDFCKYRELLAKGTAYAALFDSIAEFVAELYDGGLLVQNADEIPVMLPAVDHINPPIRTDCGFESDFPDVFVVGDAAGVSRGFVQAMWSGKCASDQVTGRLSGFMNTRKAVS